MGTLRDAWENTRRARGKHVRISGASGIGKSRLVRHFSDMARRGGAVIAEVSCDPGDLRRPLSAFMRLVPRLQNFPGAAGCSPDLRPYLDRLTQFDSGETRWPEASDTPYTLSCIERAIDELVDAVADEQPLVIVFDNAHWADEESLRLIDSIALGASTRAVLVITVSCSRAPQQADGVCVPAIPISVRPLCDAMARKLVLERSSKHEHAPHDTMIDWIVRAGEGNPLRLEELVNHWASGGAPFELPPSIAALLQERIARLGADARRVMQVVALLGRQATLARVERVTALERAAFLAAVEQLGTDGLLVMDISGEPASTLGAAPHIACRHGAIARAVLAGLSAPARAVIHREIASALDAESSRSADVLWDRAAHWSEGHELTDVVRTTVSCARHLASVGLADAGAAACRQLLAEPLSDLDRRQVLTTLAHTLHLGWKWVELGGAVASLRELEGRDDRHDDLELCLLDAKWQTQEDPDATLRIAMRCASAEDAPAAHRVRAAGTAIKLATNAGRPAAVRQAFESVAPVLNAPDVDAGDRISLEMMFHAVAGSLPLAERCAQALIRMSIILPEPRRLLALCNSAATLARAGSLSQAVALCDAAAHDAVRRSLTPLATAACHRAVNICLDAGEPDIAMQWVDRLVVLAPPDDACRQKAVMLALARIALHRGETESVRQHLAAHGTPLWLDATPAFAATALATAIAASASCGKRHTSIRQMLACILPLHRRLQGMGAHDFVAFAIARGYEAIGESRRAASLLQTYLTQHRRELFPVPGRFAAMVSAPVDG